MSTTNSHAKNRAKRLTASEKREAQLEANRKARRQWMIVGAVIAIAIVVAIVLVTVFTEGEVPVLTNPNL